MSNVKIPTHRLAATGSGEKERRGGRRARSQTTTAPTTGSPLSHVSASTVGSSSGIPASAAAQALNAASMYAAAASNAYQAMALQRQMAMEQHQIQLKETAEKLEAAGRIQEAQAKAEDAARLKAMAESEAEKARVGALQQQIKHEPQQHEVPMNGVAPTSPSNVAAPSSTSASPPADTPRTHVSVPLSSVVAMRYNGYLESLRETASVIATDVMQIDVDEFAGFAVMSGPRVWDRSSRRHNGQNRVHNMDEEEKVGTDGTRSPLFGIRPDELEDEDGYGGLFDELEADEADIQTDPELDVDIGGHENGTGMKDEDEEEEKKSMPDMPNSNESAAASSTAISAVAPPSSSRPSSSSRRSSKPQTIRRLLVSTLDGCFIRPLSPPPDPAEIEEIPAAHSYTADASDASVSVSASASASAAAAPPVKKRRRVINQYDSDSEGWSDGAGMRFSSDPSTSDEDEYDGLMDESGLGQDDDDSDYGSRRPAGRRQRRRGRGGGISVGRGRRRSRGGRPPGRPRGPRVYSIGGGVGPYAFSPADQSSAAASAASSSIHQPSPYAFAPKPSQDPSPYAFVPPQPIGPSASIAASTKPTLIPSGASQSHSRSASDGSEQQQEAPRQRSSIAAAMSAGRLGALPQSMRQHVVHPFQQLQQEWQAKYGGIHRFQPALSIPPSTASAASVPSATSTSTAPAPSPSLPHPSASSSSSASAARSSRVRRRSAHLDSDADGEDWEQDWPSDGEHGHDEQHGENETEPSRRRRKVRKIGRDDEEESDEDFQPSRDADDDE